MKKTIIREESQVSVDSTDKINLKRRVAILGAAGSATALSVWKTPIINAVITPAHAQTSDPTPNRVFFGANVVPGGIASVNLSPLDFIIPVANAGTDVQIRQYTVSIEENGDDLMVDLFEVLQVRGFDQAEILYSGVLSTISGGSLGVADNPCMLEASSIDATIASVTDTEVVINLTGRGESLTVPAGNGSVPTPMCVDTPLPTEFSLLNQPLEPQTKLGKSFNPLDLVISPSYAGEVQDLVASMTAVAGPAAGTYTVTYQEQDDFNGGRWAGTVPDDGTPGTLVLDMESCIRAPEIMATITSVSESGLDLTVSFEGSFMYTLDPVSRTLPELDCGPQ